METGDIAQVHAASKQYFKTSAQTLNQYASFYRDNRTLVQGLIDQGMSQLAPQNRDKVQQILQGFKQGNNKATDLSFKQTSITAQVLGVNCQVLAIYEKGLRIRDICLADYPQLELTQQDINSLERLKATVEQFKPSAPKKYQQLLSTLASGMKQLSGVPLKIVHYSPEGKILSIVQAGNISVRNINTDTFIIPADYEQQMFPVL